MIIKLLESESSDQLIKGFTSIWDLHPDIDFISISDINSRMEFSKFDLNGFFSDREALASDWKKIGIDMQNAIEKFKDSEG